MDAALTTSAVRDMQLKHLMDSYGSQIVRVCYTYLKDAALAEDAAQDTFVKAYRHLGHAWNVEHEKAWLMRIAINTRPPSCMRKAAPARGMSG